MKILLSFYPDFKITQLSETTARMWLSNDYDLFIDVNSNPGSWTAQRKRGTLRNDLMLRGGRVPKEDVDKADALISRYNEALITHVMEVEKRDKGMITNDLEVLRLKGKRSRQGPADPGESQERTEVSSLGKNQNLVSVPALEDQERKGQEEESHFPTAEEFGKGLNDVIGSFKSQFDKAISAQALPEEPNLEEIQEAPADQEGGEEAQSSQPEEEKSKRLARYAKNVYKQIEESKLNPGEDYDTKIEAKFKEIFEALDTEIRFAKAENEPPKNKEQADRLSKIYEALEVLHLLQELRRRQDRFFPWEAHNGQPAEAIQDQAAELNEVFLLKNSKGYSWKITARAADLEKAAEAVLQVNETFKSVAKGG